MEASEGATSTDRFYASLPAFRAFETITHGDHFAPVPDEWVVFLSDVVGSTAAIEAGRYKDVNTIGAASISCVLQTLGHDVPYVFGGDGATLVVPPGDRERVARALERLAVLSRTRFGLELRVGALPVATVREAGFDVEVARHELAGGRCIAVFRGGGLTHAEGLIKGDYERYGLGEADDGGEALRGLSCRWDRIPARQGRVVSLLVQATAADPAAVYDRVLRFLDEVFEGGIDVANPVAPSSMRYRGLFECLANERRYHPSTWSPRFWLRAGEITLCVLLFGTGLHRLFGGLRRYAESMRVHADHRKFDDMLRMVLDCSPQQVERIQGYLAEAHAAGDLRYGLFETDSALMTCYVEGIGPGEHVHFVDGADGGYAMAAKQLKAQLRAEPSGRR